MKEESLSTNFLDIKKPRILFLFLVSLVLFYNEVLIIIRLYQMMYSLITAFNINLTIQW